MSKIVLYNIYNPGVLQEKSRELAGKFLLTEIERQYVNIEDNIDSFANEAGVRLGEIYRYVIIGYSNGGNWNGLLTLYKRRLDHLLTDYINRLVESRQYAVDEIIEQMGTWIETTSGIISGIIDSQKEDVLKKGVSKGTINPTTTKKRIEALDSIRDALFQMLEDKQDRFLHDLPEMDFAELGPNAPAKFTPEYKPTKKGRGIGKIVNGAIAEKLLPPVFDTSLGGLMVTFFSSPEAQLKEAGISGRGIQAVEFALKNGRITNTDVQEMAKVSKPTATRLLASLSDYLELKGTTGKGTYYTVKGLTKGSTK